jgi:ribosomal-protein-alanine N-acetyltransferase
MSDTASHSSNVTLRPAVLGDVPAIMGIEAASFIHAGERFGERRVRYLISSPRALVTAAEADGRVLGWVVGFAWTRTREPWGRIYALAVDPSARGRRLGEKLLHQMIDALHAAGAQRIFLEVRPDNHAAVKLYKKAGFAQCRHLPNYYAPGIDAQRMVRTG